LIVDLEHADRQLLADLHDLRRILHELLGELAHVDEPVVVNADVDERAECGDVRDDALEHHAGLEILHRRDVVAEFRRLELGARIAAGFAELGGDVVERGLADVVGDVLRPIDLVDELLVADERWQIDADVGCDALDERVALGVNSGLIEWVRGARDAQEAGGLLERFRTEARDVHQLVA
jgi:hypothetical protein